MTCYDYEDSRDTTGQPILKRFCQCGGTSCLNLKYFQVFKDEERSKLNEDGIDEDKFYKKVFGR